MNHVETPCTKSAKWSQVWFLHPWPCYVAPFSGTEQKSLSRFSLFQEKPGKLIGNSCWLPFHFFPIYKVDFVTFHSAVSKKWGWQSEFQRIVQEGQVLLAWSESLPWPSISWCLRLHNDPRTQHKCQVQASDENHAWVILSAEVWSMSVLLLANYTDELSRPNAMQVSAFVEYRRRLTWRPICKIRNARTQRQTRYPFFRSDGMAGSAVSNSSLID